MDVLTKQIDEAQRLLLDPTPGNVAAAAKALEPAAAQLAALQQPAARGELDRNALLRAEQAMRRVSALLHNAGRMFNALSNCGAQGGYGRTGVLAPGACEARTLAEL